MLKAFLPKSIKVDAETMKLISSTFHLAASVKKAEVILAVGGDGTMLHIIQKYFKYGLPFIGIHKSGSPTSIGFILNKPTKRFLRELACGQMKFICTKFVAADLYSDGVYIKTVYGFNEILFERATTQAIKVKVIVNKKTYFKAIECDGMMVANSAGSTAYNANAGGEIHPIDDPCLILTGVAPGKATGWNSAALPQSAVIRLELIETDKRRARLVVDGRKNGRNITAAKIYASDIGVKIGFAKTNDFHRKVFDLQFRKKINH